MIRKYFELNKPYQFDVGDITAIIYLLCAIFGIMDYNITPLFLLGSAIGLATCWKAKRLNLVVLNGAMFALNLVGFVKMFLTN